MCYRQIWLIVLRKYPGYITFDYNMRGFIRTCTLHDEIQIMWRIIQNHFLEATNSVEKQHDKNLNTKRDEVCILEQSAEHLFFVVSNWIVIQFSKMPHFHSQHEDRLSVSTFRAVMSILCLQFKHISMWSLHIVCTYSLQYVLQMLLQMTTSDRKSTRLNSSHTVISYAVFCLKKKNKYHNSYSIPLWLQTYYHRLTTLSHH